MSVRSRYEVAKRRFMWWWHHGNDDARTRVLLGLVALGIAVGVVAAVFGILLVVMGLYRLAISVPAPTIVGIAALALIFAILFATGGTES